jgi:2-keto-3-deoxy-L-rhamnonate aldolase RhmA
MLRGRSAAPRAPRMLLENRVKTKLKAGGTVFGSWTITSAPMVANVMAETGMDFVTLDIEHGPTTIETAEGIVYAIETGGSTPMVRFGEWSEPTILRALELGVQGILVSHIDTPEQAQRVVRACLYPPDGERGLSPFTRRHGYSGQDLANKLAAANEQMLTGVLVETAEGIRNIEAIAATPNLDLIYLGIYDISLVLGKPGQVDDPEVIEVVRDCVAAIERAGVAAGAVARDRDHIRWLVDNGFRYISYLVDVAILREGFEEAVGWYGEVAR